MSLPPPLAVAASAAADREPLAAVLRRAGHKALGGGLPGAAAMFANVLTLMPLRTLVNRQYRCVVREHGRERR
jgi:hypothetical protein